MREPSLVVGYWLGSTARHLQRDGSIIPFSTGLLLCNPAFVKIPSPVCRCQWQVRDNSWPFSGWFSDIFKSSCISIVSIYMYVYTFACCCLFSKSRKRFQKPCGGYLLWVSPVRPLAQCVTLQGIALVRLLAFPACCLGGSGFALPS